MIQHYFHGYDIFQPIIIPLGEDGSGFRQVFNFLCQQGYDTAKIDDIISWLKGQLNRVYVGNACVTYDSLLPSPDVFDYVCMDTRRYDNIIG